MSTQQPKPKFFTPDEIRRMALTNGAYKYSEKKPTVWERIKSRLKRTGR